MHTMNKKKKKCAQRWDTVKRSGTPVCTHSQCCAHEEAQVFVHELNLFVTVQLLKETPAVLSLGKLCEDHG